MTIKVIVAGGRNFDNYQLLKTKLDHYLSRYIKRGDEIIIVSGKAKGADTLGERYAKERGFAIDENPADWDDIEAKGAVVRYNRNGRPYNAVAGHWRNEEMAKKATHLVAFHDGKSTGTKNMIDLGTKYKLMIKVVNY